MQEVDAMWVGGHHPGSTGVQLLLCEEGSDEMNRKKMKSVIPMTSEEKLHKVNERHKTFEAKQEKINEQLKIATERVAQIRGKFHFCDTCCKHYVYETSANKHKCHKIHSTQVINPPSIKRRKHTTHSNDHSEYLHIPFRDAAIAMTAARNTTVIAQPAAPAAAPENRCELMRGERVLISGDVTELPEPEPRCCLKKSKDYQPKTLNHMLFIKWAYSLGERNKENAVSPETAHEIMKVVGTEEGNALFPDETYMTANEHKYPTFGVADLLDIGVIRSYFSKSTAHFDRQITRLKLSAVGEEGLVPEEENEENDEEDEIIQEEEVVVDDNECVCKGLKTYKFMVMCDGCNKWYHSRCVNYKASTHRKNTPYYCPPCVEDVEGV
jgi:hypothetical protein